MSERELSNRRLWWQLAIFVVVSAAAVSVGISFNDQMERYLPESKVMRSTLNRRPSGYSALLELTTKVGLAARPWQKPYRKLTDCRGMLVIVQPDQTLSPYEVDQILAWVKAGNDLIYLDNFTFAFERRMLERLGLKARTGPPLADAAIPVSGAAPELAHVESLTVTAGERLQGGETLVADQAGTLLSAVRYGDGRVFVGAVPSLCANLRLADRGSWDNFQLLINFFRTARGDILFDELCHGHVLSTNVFTFLGRGPAGLVSLQLIIILLVAVASAAQRFGSVEVLAASRKVSSLEYIDGLSNTYSRAKATGAAWETIRHAFRNRLGRLVGVSPHEPPEKLAQAWSAVSARPPADLLALLEADGSAAAGRRLSEEELVSLVAACDKITEQSQELFSSRKGKAS